MNKKIIYLSMISVITLAILFIINNPSIEIVTETNANTTIQATKPKEPIILTPIEDGFTVVEHSIIIKLDDAKIYFEYPSNYISTGFRRGNVYIEKADGTYIIEDINWFFNGSKLFVWRD